MGRSFGSGSHSSGGRSFGSGSFGGSRSFGSGSFGGTRSFGGSRSFGGGSSHRPTFRWRPHTTVVFGRPVYFGKGRSAAVSLLSIFIYIAIIATVICGFMWWDYQGVVDDTVENYVFYHNVAVDADGNPNRQIQGNVEAVYPYEDTGVYYFEYSYDINNVWYEGTSFCVYDKETVDQLLENGKVTLAINSNKEHMDSKTCTIPLDHKDIKLEDDVWYLDDLQSRNLFRILTFVAGGATVALAVASVVLSVTAKQATKEQLAENANGSMSQNTQATTNGNWRCSYCNTLNDSTKTQCDGCGAGRQK